MTAPLEMRNRRLLAAYPREHRHAYEEEMVEVPLVALAVAAAVLRLRESRPGAPKPAGVARQR